jgi:hypothetical protein
MEKSRGKLQTQIAAASVDKEIKISAGFPAGG